MDERIIFLGRNSNYILTHLCFNELVDYLKDKAHEVVMTVVSDDSHGEKGTLEYLAEKAGFPWMSAPLDNNVNDKSFISELKNLNPSLLITVQFPMIYKEPFIAVPSRANLNIHRGWPLRGGSIDERSIFHGVDEYNVILHHVTPGIDTGNIIGKILIELAKDETGYSLVQKADKAAVELFINCFLPLIGDQIPEGNKQNLEETIYGSKGSISSAIDFTRPSEEIERLSRAFYHPRKKGAELKISEDMVYLVSPVEIIPEGRGLDTGMISSLGETVIIGTRDYPVSIREIHFGDKNPSSFRDYLRGKGLREGDYI